MVFLLSMSSCSFVALFQSLSVAVSAVLAKATTFRTVQSQQRLKISTASILTACLAHGRVFPKWTFLCASNTMWLEKLKSTAAFREADE
jgi:hypothetical protein